MFSGNKLNQFWVTCAYACLFLVAILGVLMRSIFFVALPIPFHHLLHAHSHTALLGWSFIMSTSAIFAYYKLELSNFKYEILSFSIALVGMFFSFLYQAYGAISISFSSLFIFTSYVFFYRILKKVKKLSFQNPLYEWGMIWFLVSTLGIWCIAPVSIFLGKQHELYALSIQFFMHFQINAWLVYTALGILFKHLNLKPSKKIILGLNSSLILTFALNVYWINHHILFYLLNALGLIIQMLVYFKIGISLYQKTRIPLKKLQWFYFLIVSILFLKPVLQLVTLYPDWALHLEFNRFLIIAFLHFVLIGLVSFSFVYYGIQEKLIQNNFISRVGIFFWVIGFLVTEVILFLQGIGLFHFLFYSILCFFSLLMLIGIGLLFYQRIKSFNLLNKKSFH